MHHFKLFQADQSAGPSRPTGRPRSSSHREIGEPGTSVPLATENEAFEMDVEADYNIAPPSYDEVRKQKSIY